MPVARSRVSWRPKLDLPSEPSRSRSVLKPRKSRLLSVISNSRLVWASPVCPPTLDCARRIVRLGRPDVIFLLHALDQVLDQFVERAIGLHLLEAVRAFPRREISIPASLLDGLAQIVERLLIRC